MIKDALPFHLPGREDVENLSPHFFLHPKVNRDPHPAFGPVKNRVGQASGKGLFHDHFFLAVCEFAGRWNGKAQADNFLIKKRRERAKVVGREHTLDFWLNKVCSLQSLIDEHELVQEAAGRPEFEVRRKRIFEFLFGIEQVPEFRSQKS